MASGQRIFRRAASRAITRHGGKTPMAGTRQGDTGMTAPARRGVAWRGAASVAGVAA